jgi:hypothetical protein
VSKTTTQPHRWLPSAADGITVTPNGSAFTYTAWVEMSAAVSEDMYCTHLDMVVNDWATVGSRYIQAQIGVGAAGLEVPVFTVKIGSGDNQQWGPRSAIPLGLIYDHIASGARVSVRMMHSVADADIYKFAIGYLPGLGGSTGRTANAQTASPIDSTTIGIAASVGTWAASTWSEIFASTSVSTYITGVVITSSVSRIEFDLGVGAAGSEVVILTLPWRANDGDGHDYTRLPHPIRVPAGVRVAMRQRGTNADACLGHIWHLPS